jgi:hypothetical protein
MVNIIQIVTASNLPTTKNNKKLNSSFNSRWLDKQEGIIGMYEMIRLPSIGGGTSAYGGIH